MVRMWTGGTEEEEGKALGFVERYKGKKNAHKVLSLLEQNSFLFLSATPITETHHSRKCSVKELQSRVARLSIMLQCRVCFCLTESVTSMWSPWKTTVLKVGQCVSRARRGGGK